MSGWHGGKHWKTLLFLWFSFSDLYLRPKGGDVGRRTCFFFWNHFHKKMEHASREFSSKNMHQVYFPWKPLARANHHTCAQSSTKPSLRVGITQSVKVLCLLSLLLLPRHRLSSTQNKCILCSLRRKDDRRGRCCWVSVQQGEREQYQNRGQNQYNIGL